MIPGLRRKIALSEQQLTLLFGFCVLATSACFSLSLISHAIRLVGGLFS